MDEDELDELAPEGAHVPLRVLHEFVHRSVAADEVTQAADEVTRVMQIGAAEPFVVVAHTVDEAITLPGNYTVKERRISQPVRDAAVELIEKLRANRDSLPNGI